MLDQTAISRGHATAPSNNPDFHRLLETLPAGAYTCNAEGLITFYNRRAVDVWGREPRLLDPVDRYCGSFRLHLPDGTPITHDYCWMARAIQDRKPYNGQEIVVEREDGRRLTVLAHANPLFDDSGQLTGAVNVLVDISDRKAAENALRESDRRKNEFLAMLAHELRNPLAPIANAVELIRIAGSDPAMVEEARALIDRQLQQMVRLVDDLMDVSRISRNKLELRMERIDLVTAVRNALESVRPLIDAADHELVLALPDRPIPVDGDLVRLSQAFANLLNNAAKFTPACGRIAIKAAVEDGHAVVRVSDNGVGIPPESLPDIFEMFTQLDRGIERQHGGLGIGLTLVKELTEMHGGRVEAHSNGVGHGAEFVVHLPLAVPQSESQGTTAARPKGFGASSRHRILVVDDNRDSAHSLATLLRLQGHEVWTAYNGLDAVEAVESFQPAVILLDIGLPGLSGYEVAERIRGKHNGATPLLLAMTGWGQEEDRRRSRESGFAAHLVKPVSLDRILEFLEHLPLAAK